MLSLNRAVVPLIQGFEDAGDFTVTERLRTSVHANLLFYLIVGSIGLFGLILLITMHKIRYMSCVPKFDFLFCSIMVSSWPTLSMPKVPQDLY